MSVMENTKKNTRQRKKELQNNIENELSDNIEKQEEKNEEPPKKNLKYYFNRFRYYHYYYAEKINSFITIVCMWILKIQFYLMGFRVNGLPSIHEIEERGLEEK
ncbi:PREDICTED: uncharacterized protein LOC105454334 [Wasmannia auropunctata]|uniref:uncharacterized protein LOC105454334 n=1 Tax=Wasmannia auropunctata TaxID=64793 RepID=UPI0005EDA0FF|nr:PREDICTED: uncharacterized protein LOC105454334 [Wasmannia auropunctata]